MSGQNLKLSSSEITRHNLSRYPTKNMFSHIIDSRLKFKIPKVKQKAHFKGTQPEMAHTHTHNQKKSSVIQFSVLRTFGWGGNSWNANCLPLKIRWRRRTSRMVEVQITQPNESQHKLGGGRNKPRVPSQAKPTATVTIKHPCLIFMAKKPHICDKLGKIKLFFFLRFCSLSLFDGVISCLRSGGPSTLVSGWRLVQKAGRMRLPYC